jgi:hypothetical protein
MAKDDIFIAVESGMATIPGSAAPFLFRRGITRVKPGHPVLKVCPNNFEKEGPNAQRRARADNRAAETPSEPR